MLLTRYLLGIEWLLTDGLTLSLLIVGPFALGINLMKQIPTKMLPKATFIVGITFIRDTPSKVVLPVLL